MSIQETRLRQRASEVAPPPVPPLRRWSPAGSTPAAPGKPTGHRADIQGLRALAVLLVVAFHAGLPVRGGYVGVDIFFVISGFVITAMIMRELETTGRLSLTQFYTRRMRRILPALAATLIAVAVGGFFLLSPLGMQQYVSKTGIASSLFMANGYLARGAGYFGPDAETNPLLHTWSLAVEEQFYFVFPVLLALAWKLARRRFSRFSPRVVTGSFLLVGTIGSFVLSLAVMNRQSLAFYASPTRAWEFAVGGLLALAVPALVKLGKTTAVTAGIFGSVLVAIAATTFSAETPFPGTAALLPVLGTALLIVAGTPSTDDFAQFLSGRRLVRIGDLSYGWYLWHWPAIVFARALWPNAGWTVPLVAAASLGAASASYRWIETPIRNNPKITGRRILCLAAACIAMPILACLALWRLANPAFDTAELKNIRQQAGIHADAARGCMNPVPLGQRRGLTCTWAVDEPRGTVFLVGDSNAGQLTEGVALAANQQRYNFTVATQGACPFVDLKMTNPSNVSDLEACRHFVKETVAELKRLRPQLVIIASSATEYIKQPQYQFASSTGASTRNTGEKARLWADGLASILHDLDQSGVPTLVVHTVPHFEEFSLPLKCPAFRLRLDARPCGTQLSRNEVARQQHLARTAEQAALARNPRAAAVDFTNDLCNATTCTTNNGNTWLYRDAIHLSVNGALALTDRFKELIGLHAGSSDVLP